MFIFITLSFYVGVWVVIIIFDIRVYFVVDGGSDWACGSFVLGVW